MLKRPNLTIHIPGEDGEPDTLVRGDIYLFEHGKAVGIFSLHERNESKKTLQEVRKDLVYGICEVYTEIQPANLRYLEDERFFDGRYAERAFLRSQNGYVVEDKRPGKREQRHTPEQVERLLSIYEKEEADLRLGPRWHESLKPPPKPRL